MSEVKFAEVVPDGPPEKCSSEHGPCRAMQLCAEQLVDVSAVVIGRTPKLGFWSEEADCYIGFNFCPYCGVKYADISLPLLQEDWVNAAKCQKEC